MKWTRGSLLLVHIGRLALGWFIATLAVGSVLDNIDMDSTLRAVHRASIAVALVS
jgi:hypothetical protein